jgi:hypothetical protein
MANRAFRRDSCTLQNEQVIIEGQIVLSSSAGGVVQGRISVNGLTGSLPTVISGGLNSSPNTTVSQYTVQRVQSGSYILFLKDTYPKLLDFQVQASASGSNFSSFSARHDTGLQTNSLSALSGGVNQIGISVFSGSFLSPTGGLTLADPVGTGVLTLDIHLALANSTV